MFVKPIPPTKSTQSQHWQFDGFHFRIFCLKRSQSISIPNICWYRISDHWTKVLNRTFSKFSRVDIGNRIESFWGPLDIKPYNDSFNWNRSEKSGFEISFNALNISIAKFWIFCSWIVKVPSLDNSSSILVLD